VDFTDIYNQKEALIYELSDRFSTSVNIKKQKPEYVHALSIDWESDLLNYVKIRSGGDSTNLLDVRGLGQVSFRNSINSSSAQWGLFKNWGTSVMNKDSFMPFDRTMQPLGTPTGYIDGNLVFQVTKEVEKVTPLTYAPKITMKGLDGTMRKLNLVELGKGNNMPFILPVPCENVQERQYALGAVYWKDYVFLYNRTTSDFSKYVPIDDRTRDNSFGIVFDTKIIPYLEGNRLRSFLHTKCSLIELIWDGQNKDALLCIEHLQWLKGNVKNILRLGEEFGFFIETTSGGFVYKPSCAGQSLGDGTIKSIHNKPPHGDLTYGWSISSKCLIDFQKTMNPSDITNLVSFDSKLLESLPSKNCSDFYKESDLEQDYSWTNYCPSIITDVLTVYKKDHSLMVMCGFKGDTLYMPTKDRHNEMKLLQDLIVESLPIN